MPFVSCRNLLHTHWLTGYCSDIQHHQPQSTKTCDNLKDLSISLRALDPQHELCQGKTVNNSAGAASPLNNILDPARHVEQQITGSRIPQKRTLWFFTSKYISCVWSTELHRDTPEPCTALSNNAGLVLTFILIMATSTWICLIIVVPANRFCLSPLSVYLFTLREVCQLTNIRTALRIIVSRHKALIQFWLCLNLMISASLSSWIILVCCQLVMKVVIHISLQETVHSQQWNPRPPLLRCPYIN